LNDTKVQQAWCQCFEWHEGTAIYLQVKWHHQAWCLERQSAASPTLKTQMEDPTANVLTMVGWGSEQSCPALHHGFLF
jgi:hypothetical protein